MPIDSGISAPLLRLIQIRKSFSGVQALRGVSIELQKGECLGLLGENGAGKSTLMKVISGVFPAGSYEGEIQLEGELKEFRRPIDASQAGIHIVHQELALFENLSVAENLFMGEMPRTSLGSLDRMKMISETAAHLKKLDIHLDPEAPLKSLRIGQKQLIEIARAFRSPHLKVLLLDEPTSALADSEIENLFKLLRDFKKRGLGLIYISHKMAEIEEICDRLTVLRDGESVGEFKKGDFARERLVEAMVGRKIESVYPPQIKVPADEVSFRVEQLSVHEKNHLRPLLDRVSFELKRGEIFGISGLMGSGRSLLLRSLIGDTSEIRVDYQKIEIDGEAYAPQDPYHAMKRGVCLVTEDRKGSGLFLDLEVGKNLSLPILRRLSSGPMDRIRRSEESALIRDQMRKLNVKPKDPTKLIRYLSGGNQQKVILARWLCALPKVLLLDEPTRGIDIGAKAEIYSLLRQLTSEGLSIILVSSELPELVSMADRILVLREGQSMGILEGLERTQEKIMERAAA